MPKTKGSVLDICANCGGEYRKFPYEIDRKCCSIKCGMEHRRTRQVIQCQTCNKKFVREYAEIQRRKNHYCSKKCFHESMVGKKHHGFKGGSLNKQGYKIIYIDKKRIFEHRHIVETHIGRKLNRDEIVHHINGNVIDNRIENLKIMNRTNHTSFHSSCNKWSRKYSECQMCKSTDRKHEGNGYCMMCYQRVRKQLDLYQNSPEEEK